MGEAHSHGGAIPSAAGRHRKPLYAALALTLTYMTAEIIGGIWTGSLALIADAAHMATDAGGLGLALFAIQSPVKNFQAVDLESRNGILPWLDLPESGLLERDSLQT